MNSVAAEQWREHSMQWLIHIEKIDITVFKWEEGRLGREDAKKLTVVSNLVGCGNICTVILRLLYK